MNKGSKLPKLKQTILPIEKPIIVRLRCFFLILLAIASLTAGSFARSDRSDRKDEKASASGVSCTVSNFGKVTENYYRGGQPEREEYSQLATLGVKTIIDLRDDPKDYAREMAERAGMNYINMPMSDSRYPTQDLTSKFLSLVNNQENWPVYVHCAGGRHRTGAMTAVFRMSTQGWDIDRAYEEMKDYDFYTRWGHKSMKRFVYDYYRELMQHRETQLGDQTEK